MTMSTTEKEGALDAAIAAWFGITQVGPHENILRERMAAAVEAYNKALLGAWITPEARREAPQRAGGQ